MYLFFFHSAVFLLLFLVKISLSLFHRMLQLNIDGLEIAEEEPQILRVLRRGQVCPQTRSTERMGKYESGVSRATKEGKTVQLSRWGGLRCT